MKGGKLTTSDTYKKTMVNALTATLGVVSPACKLAGISRQTHYRWMQEDPEYKQAVEDVSEETIDFVEDALHGLIKKGDTAATIFYMKTKAKKRGYVERQEITGADGKGFEVKIQPSPGCEPMKDEGTPDNIHSSL